VEVLCVQSMAGRAVGFFDIERVEKAV